MIKNSIVAVFACAGIASCSLASVTLSGSSGSLAASATFEVSGTNLVVTLTNTATSDVLVPADILTSLFMNINGGALSLTPVSAVLADGSFVVYDDQPAAGVVGGEWQYVGGISPGGILAGMNYGIGSAGLGIFGSPNFPGANLGGPGGVNGLQYGIVSAGDNPATGNGGVTGAEGLIKNSVVFTLSGLPQNFDLNRIVDVFFLYGTAIGEGGFHAPTPGAAALLGLGGVAMLRRRR